MGGARRLVGSGGVHAAGGREGRGRGPVHTWLEVAGRGGRRRGERLDGRPPDPIEEFAFEGGEDAYHGRGRHARLRAAARLGEGVDGKLGDELQPCSGDVQIGLGRVERVRVVPEGEGLAGDAEMLDRGGLVHAQADGALGRRQRVQPPVGTADGQQGAANHPVRVPVQQVVDWVGRGDADGGDGEGEREALGDEGLDRLGHPRDVADQDGPPCHAVQPRTALDQTEQHGRPPWQEDVDESVGQAHGVPAGGGGGEFAGDGERDGAGGQAQRSVAGRDGGDDVDGTHEPRDWSLQDVLRPPAPLCQQVSADAAVTQLLPCLVQLGVFTHTRGL
mmetsp:Transcript_13032/g.42687  ORF Transcript_13032/g.42687 Transcript_13032/m.42687 type:complete len:333 (+) Transcript_13032:1130-2128(+)